MNAPRLARVGDAVAAAGLRAAGYTRITRLVFLRSDAGRILPPPDLHLEAYSAATVAAFGEVLLASYIGTLDCPELNDDRPAGAILGMYCGTAGTAEWYLARVGGVPAAILLLTPALATWGLAYLGLAPAFRGRGLGTKLTQFALARSGGALSLNVDERNLAALAIYAKFGFRAYAESDVYLQLDGAT